MLWRAICRIPLIGWMLRDAAEGREDAKVWFLIDLLLIWGLAIWLWGYPALIIPLMGITALIFVLLLLVTAGR